jgi:hypothetical protein
MIGNGQSQTAAHHDPLHQSRRDHTPIAENRVRMEIIEPFVWHASSPLISCHPEMLHFHFVLIGCVLPAK